MALLKLIDQDSTVSRPRLLAMAALSGIANAAALGVVNAAAEAAARGEAHLGAAIGLLGAIATYVVAQRYVMRVCADEVEAVVARLRMQLVERVMQADLLPLERLGIGEIYAAIAGETLTISQAANMLVIGFQAAFAAVFVLIYVGLLSLPALILSLAMVGLASRLHLRRLSILGGHFERSMQADAALFGALDDAVAGIKEIRLDPLLRDAVAADVGARSLETMQARIGLQDAVAREYVFMQALFFLLLTAVVFVVPDYAPHRPAVTIQVATSMLFVAGSLSILLQTVPAYARANAAAERIQAIAIRLAAAVPQPAMERDQGFELFATVGLAGAEFAYDPVAGEAGFSVGPIDLEIRRGEVVFVVGGNGSGKSTLLKLLTGLYRPERGAVCVDGMPVDRAAAAAYRSLFSIIFADFHLFERLYGIEIDRDLLATGLSWTGLAGKTRLDGDRFVTVDLSAGQRKRLAMLVAEQEKRPVLVLDEWTAEQDPQFRRFFYRDLLAELRRRGVTVIAATHDDQYFDAADRVLRMEEGTLRG